MNQGELIQEKIGRKRFKSGIEFEKSLLKLTRAIQDRLLNNLPSNYTRDRNTNLAEFFRSVAKEFARLQVSSSDINEDRYHDSTRTDYLFQVLGDSLFLGEKTINENLDDVSYKNFLIKVRNAYFGGSRKDNIENAVSDILGLPVTIKETYLQLRRDCSSYTVKDTHKMFFDILMDRIEPSSNIGVLFEDIRFFIDMIKPAHVIYNTRLIWSDEFKSSDGECKPSYITQNLEYDVYGVSRIQMTAWLTTKIIKFFGYDPDETWEEGVISIHDLQKQTIYTVDNKIIVYDDSTKLLSRDVDDGDIPIIAENLIAGDSIKYYGVRDGVNSSDVIDGTWEYTGTVDDIYQNEEVISLKDGSLLIYGEDTLMYTRDGGGEYRIEPDDIRPNYDISFKAEKYTRSFQFYQTPQEVKDNWYKQFDSNIQKKSTFQDYVYKYPDIRSGYTGAQYDVIIEDGTARVVKIDSKFYKKDNTANYKEIPVYRYSLYFKEGDTSQTNISGQLVNIDSVNYQYETQFSVDNPERSLTNTEAKNIFASVYGYTGLNNINTSYMIDIAKTGELIENGASAQVQAVDGQTEFCDRQASCHLSPYYEDMRKFWKWPDMQLTSGFFNVNHNFFDGVQNIQVSSDEGIVSIQNTPDENEDGILDVVQFGPGQLEDEYNLPAWFYLSSDPNVYAMPLLPMLNAEGCPISESEVSVYIDGLLVENAVTSVDPWNGIISLNFIPPFNTKVRIDYYHAARYPSPVFYMKHIITEYQKQGEGNLVGQFSVIQVDGNIRRLWWPYEVDEALYGDDLDWQVDKFPILNQRGELAAKDEVNVFIGSIITEGTVKVISIETEGISTGTTLQSAGADWEGVQDGDVIVIDFENYFDNTHIYVVEDVNLIDDTLRVTNILPVLGASYSYKIIHFVEVEDAIEDMRPIIGHVRLNFLPPLDSILKFNYYYTGDERNYLMLPDDRAQVVNGWDTGASSYTPDTFYGSRNRYTLMVDQNPGLCDTPYWSWDALLKYGYRYRMFHLPHTSALDSNTLFLDSYSKNTHQASFKNKSGRLDHYDVQFSPEHLYDADKNVVLNERYLYKNIPALTRLNPGVPLFAKTFSDDTHHSIKFIAVEKDTYDPTLSESHDLKGSFKIIDPDYSGIVDYNPICDYENNNRVNIYTDFKKVIQSNNGYDAHLSTIDDSAIAQPFKISMVERYYPNRELRLNDYMDYVNQVPSEHRTGSLKVLNESTVVKSLQGNFKALRLGDIFTIKQVPCVEGSSIVYREEDYVLIEIIDFETGRFHKPFAGPNGTYEYDLLRNRTYAVDVYLGEVQRILVLNGDISHSYNIPNTVLQHLPGYGVSGASTQWSFSDPDQDPYPRNPDNPWIPNPDITYYDIPQYTIDGKLYRTNRSQGITGIVKTSQIVDYAGRSSGYTGGYAGVTGPSGAVDLGITGPVDIANPRAIDPFDVYQVPSTESGAFFSYSEAEYRVQWRNWDQEMIIIGLGETGGITVEDPFTSLDDVGEGIKISFWDVTNAQLREIRFNGSIMYTSELVSASVMTSSYPFGMILLTYDQVDEIQSSNDPVIDLPDLHLGDTNYQLNRMIVRELLHDNSIKITEIQQFFPL